MDGWPWLAIAALGAFHGLNPAMGWLFAVALGLHRQERRVVWLALLPIALGHAVSIAAAAVVFLIVGQIIDGWILRVASGLILIAWALYHWRFGHRHRVRFGIQVGLGGLFVWSFLMATAHGAGLMLWPALAPLCFSDGGSLATVSLPWMIALAGVGAHALAMLFVTAAIAVTVYEWVGLGILRSAWLNVDALWIVALLATGIIMLVGVF